MVALDGSAGAQRALQAALQIVREQELDLWIVSVEENIPRYAATVDEFDAEQERANHEVQVFQEVAEALARQQGTRVQRVTLLGHPAKAIVDYAKSGAFDLLILGHSGHSNLWGQFLGTNADKIVRHAPCTVMVVR
jgi:nucleotide-binding universal stress UspA family protein